MSFYLRLDWGGGKCIQPLFRPVDPVSSYDHGKVELIFLRLLNEWNLTKNAQISVDSCRNRGKCTYSQVTFWPPFWHTILHKGVSLPFLSNWYFIISFVHRILAGNSATPTWPTDPFCYTITNREYHFSLWILNNRYLTINFGQKCTNPQKTNGRRNQIQTPIWPVDPFFCHMITEKNNWSLSKY